MYVNVSIDASDLEDIDAHDLAELFEDLSTKEQEEFFGIIHKDIKPLERIRAILSNLSNDEALKLLKELNNEFKSDEEWQKTIKSINGETMKLQDFDFRVWDKDEKCFLDPYTKSRAVVKNLPNEKLLNLEIELFTGLCDKNGNKIYEGDILYSFEDCSEDEAFKYKVVFKEEAFYLVECGDNGEEYDEDLISEFRLTELEIMGNIHENAELLRI